MYEVKDEQALFRQACSQQDVAALIWLNGTSGDYDLWTSIQMKLANWACTHLEAFELAVLQGEAPLDVRREALRRLVNANAQRAVLVERHQRVGGVALLCSCSCFDKARFIPYNLYNINSFLTFDHTD